MAQSWLELAERAVDDAETTVVDGATAVSGTPPSD
jgi:hypothetical protein